MGRLSIWALVIVAFVATGGFAIVIPDSAHALTRRDFCTAVRYCSIPVRYRSGPFLAKPSIREVSLAEIQRKCSPNGRAAKPGTLSDHLLGCARLQGASCVVYVPREVRKISKDIFDMVLAHELAHCRGWVH